MKYLPYDPGILPTKPAPLAGESIIIKVSGYPPYKDEHFSLRNPRHPNYEAFIRLRKAATAAMDGRSWYFGPVGMSVTLLAPCFEKGKILLDYVGGIQDTLDGSSGSQFTYLPIVFEDDCQVVYGSDQFVVSDITSYEIVIDFLSNRLDVDNEETAS
ncbi:MAG: hypothetical protein JXA81_02760 [Sedimentisphaerales bacterium]|nr:hypothetical protein [Sedimentisphaerales bacterium]